MKNVSPNFVADENDLDGDVDALFSQLEQCEPPVDMVARIMGALASLPMPLPQRVSIFDNLEELVVMYDPMQLS